LALFHRRARLSGVRRRRGRRRAISVPFDDHRPIGNEQEPATADRDSRFSVASQRAPVTGSQEGPAWAALHAARSARFNSVQDAIAWQLCAEPHRRFTPLVRHPL